MGLNVDELEKRARSVQNGDVALLEFEVVPQRPAFDPYRLARTRIVATDTESAVQYLIDGAGWVNRSVMHGVLASTYLLRATCGTPWFHGKQPEWLQACAAGMFEYLVLSPEAMTQEKLDQRTIPRPGIQFVQGKPKLLDRVEDFLSRQGQYKRTWKAVAVIGASFVGVACIFLLWQMIAATISSVIAVAVGIRVLRNA